MLEEKVEVLVNGEWIIGWRGYGSDSHPLFPSDLFPNDIAIFTDKGCILTDTSRIRAFSKKQIFNI